MSITAPPSVLRILKGLDSEPIHPGLRLDRYLIPGDQKNQKNCLDKVIEDYNAHAGQANLNSLLNRVRAMREHEGAQSWSRTTATPLTLHLARAGVLENAGILLHRVHGVPYLPGSSLKGLARAFAETVWAPSQPNPAEAWAKLNAVFGRTAETDKVGKGEEKPWKPPDVDKLPETAGAIVFHDAWPTSWPRLTVDIVNCHHKSYYQGQEGKTPDPPGDWEDPEPSYFLAVKPGASFEFALSGGSEGRDAQLISLVRAWLDGALSHLGFGAKTAAGYGYFRPESPPTPRLDSKTIDIWTGALSGQANQPPRRAERVYHLTLVTPAYLAGASQDRGDCGLTSGAARGLLRYWWRALHAGHLRPAALRELESLLWGDTRAGGLIQSIVTPVGNITPERSVYRGYLNYGMPQNQRWLAPAGSRWRLRLIARSRGDVPGLKAQDALDQAHAALWCWSHLGGVGSKCRKGYGSFVLAPLSPSDSLDRCEEIAKSIHPWAASQAQFLPSLAEQSSPPPKDESPSLAGRIGPQEWIFRSKDADTALRYIDQAYRQVVKELPQGDRLALGLPRRGQGRRSDERHASPVHVHVETNSSGRIVVRVVALPSSRLDPSSKTNREVLKYFMGRLGEAFGSWLYVSPPTPAPPAVKKIEKGQTREGMVILKEDRWAVKFEGEVRPVRLARNPNFDSLGPNLQGSKVECYILEANKRGINARIDKFLK